MFKRNALPILFAAFGIDSHQSFRSSGAAGPAAENDDQFPHAKRRVLAMFIAKEGVLREVRLDVSLYLARKHRCRHDRQREAVMTNSSMELGAAAKFARAPSYPWAGMLNKGTLLR